MGQPWQKILIVSNMIAFALGVVIFYFAFDLQWGITQTAASWGLPIMIASLLALTASAFVWRRKSRKWGLSGLGVVIAALIYMGIMLHSFSWVLLPPQEQIPQSEENEIMALVLSERFSKDGDYTIVSPFTAVPDIELATVKELLNEHGYDFTELLNRFFELNDRSVRLNLNSSPPKGYYVDYERMFWRYIEYGNGASLRWLLFHPQASGYTSVSMPAYDSETGYFLIYIGHSSVSHRHPGGSGEILLYKYKDGDLTFIDIVPIWIS